MFESFIINAIIGGLGIAIIAGVLGSFVLWRNMAYFGDALSHSALLGVSIGILLNLNLSFAVILIAIIFALCLSYNKFRYSNDTTLGILSYSSLSFAIILASFNKIKLDLVSYLFGDVLAINLTDIYYLASCLILISIWLYKNWSKLILLSISEELLQADGINSQKLKLKFTLILSLFIAISFKIVGVLLITAMLIIPAASALCISRTPLQMVSYSVIIGCISVLLGISSAVQYDIPTGPAIVIAALLIFITTNATKHLETFLRKR